MSDQEAIDQQAADEAYVLEAAETNGIFYNSTRGTEGPYVMDTFFDLVFGGYVVDETLVCYDGETWEEYHASYLAYLYSMDAAASEAVQEQALEQSASEDSEDSEDSKGEQVQGEQEQKTKDVDDADAGGASSSDDEEVEDQQALMSSQVEPQPTTPVKAQLPDTALLELSRMAANVPGFDSASDEEDEESDSSSDDDDGGGEEVGVIVNIATTTTAAAAAMNPAGGSPGGHVSAAVPAPELESSQLEEERDSKSTEDSSETESDSESDSESEAETETKTKPQPKSERTPPPKPQLEPEPEPEPFETLQVWIRDEDFPENVWTRMLVKVPIVSATDTSNGAKAIGDFKSPEFLDVEIPSTGKRSTLEYSRLQSFDVCEVNEGDAQEQKGGFRETSNYNLTQLQHLNVPNILNTLQTRFHKNEKYIHLGMTSMVVVSCYNQMESQDMPSVDDYYGKGVEIESHMDFLDKHPHPWSLAEKAFQFLRIMLSSQLISLSGQTGSGKTFAATLMRNYLIARNKVIVGKSLDDSPTMQALTDYAPIELRLTSARKVLDSFGKCGQFNSIESSKFGDISKLYYEHSGDPAAHFTKRDSPALVGGQIEVLLFKKCTVTCTDDDSRNFNVFYQLLAGEQTDMYQELKHFSLGKPQNYRYLVGKTGASNLSLGSAENDAAEFDSLMESLQVVGFSSVESSGMFRVLIALMHLANVQFATYVSEDSGVEEVEESYTYIKDERPLQSSADALGVERDALYDTLLRANLKTSSTSPRGDANIAVQNNPMQCGFARDQISRVLYQALFECILEQINHCIAPPKVDGVVKPGGRILGKNEERPYICMIDMPGFINDEENSYFEFLSNYGNEKFRNNFFNQTFGAFKSFYYFSHLDGELDNDVAALSLNPFLQSRLDKLKSTTFPFNTECLELFEHPRWGILSQLDKCSSKRDTDINDESVISALCKSREISRNKNFSWGGDLESAINCGLESVEPESFFIQHYEGTLQYRVYFAEHTTLNERSAHASEDCWARRNLDTQPRNLVPLCLSSLVPEVRAIATTLGSLREMKDKDKMEMTSTSLIAAHAKADNAKEEEKQAPRFPSTFMNANERAKPSEEIEETQDLCKAGKFTLRMQEMCELLRSTTCLHLRCIVANYSMDPLEFSRSAVVSQINSSSILEHTQICAVKEPVVLPFQCFLQNVQQQLDLVMHHFQHQPIEAVVACLLQIANLPIEAYVIDFENRAVVLDRKYLFITLRRLKGHEPGSDGEERFCQKLIDMSTNYEKTVSIAGACKAELNAAEDDLKLILSLKDKVTTLCDHGTSILREGFQDVGDLQSIADMSVRGESINIASTSGDQDMALKRSKLTKVLQPAKSTLHKCMTEYRRNLALCESARKICESSHKYSRHCWLKVVETEANSLMHLMKTVKEFSTNLITSLIETLEAFSTVELDVLATEATYLLRIAREEVEDEGIESKGGEATGKTQANDTTHLPGSSTPDTKNSNANNNNNSDAVSSLGSISSNAGVADPDTHVFSPETSTADLVAKSAEPAALTASALHELESVSVSNGGALPKKKRTSSITGSIANSVTSRRSSVKNHPLYKKFLKKKLSAAVEVSATVVAEVKYDEKQVLSWTNWLAKACPAIDLDKEEDSDLVTKYSKEILQKGYATAGNLAKGLNGEAGECSFVDATGWIVDNFQLKFAHAKGVVQKLNENGFFTPVDTTATAVEVVREEEGVEEEEAKGGEAKKVNKGDLEAASGSANDAEPTLEVKAWVQWFSDFTPKIDSALYIEYGKKIMSCNGNIHGAFRITTPEALAVVFTKEADYLANSLGFNPTDSEEIALALTDAGLLSCMPISPMAVVPLRGREGRRASLSLKAQAPAARRPSAELRKLAGTVNSPSTRRPSTEFSRRPSLESMSMSSPGAGAGASAEAKDDGNGSATEVSSEVDEQQPEVVRSLTASFPRKAAISGASRIIGTNSTNAADGHARAPPPPPMRRSSTLGSPMTTTSAVAGASRGPMSPLGGAGSPQKSTSESILMLSNVAHSSAAGPASRAKRLNL